MNRFKNHTIEDDFKESLERLFKEAISPNLYPDSRAWYESLKGMERTKMLLIITKYYFMGELKDFLGFKGMSPYPQVNESESMQTKEYV